MEMTNESEYIKKSIEIKASDDHVWNVLTNPEYTSQWGNAFYEGTYVESDWTEGASVEWKMADGETAVKGTVEINYAPRLLKVVFPGENNNDEGKPMGDYHEHYSLLEKEGNTTLTIESGPLKASDVKDHAPLWDKAFGIIKQLAEAL